MTKVFVNKIIRCFKACAMTLLFNKFDSKNVIIKNKQMHLNSILGWLEKSLLVHIKET